MTRGWPDADAITSLWAFLGPTGQCAAALQILGSSANTYRNFAGYNKGTFLPEMAASPLDVGCILLGLLLSGMGSIWALISFYAMVEKAWQRELRWHMNWNTTIFPTATLTTSFLLFSIEMDSPAFRTVTTALVILMVLNLFFTLLHISKGNLLIVRRNPRAGHVD